MSIAKVARFYKEFGFTRTISKTFREGRRALSNLSTLKIRKCLACERMSVFLRTYDTQEAECCMRCGANLRYEMLAQLIRSKFGDRLKSMSVMELDPNSPLRHVLRNAATYIRTYYKVGDEGGSIRAIDGAQAEDITNLTLGNAFLDLIVSSDVLEHVPDLHRAFEESARVLKPGGVHLFTVPVCRVTERRAILVDDGIQHLMSAEYHLDPLDTKGILAFWNIGFDLPEVIAHADLDISIAMGPCGDDGRIIWKATRI
jgi:SAM-dependent methyltransferase